MQNPESVQEKETHKIPRDCEIEMDRLIWARRPCIVIMKQKENLPNSGLCHSGWPPVKTEKKSEKIDMYQDLARELKNYETWKWRWYEL